MLLRLYFHFSESAKNHGKSWKKEERGAEKILEKKQNALEADASRCFKIDVLFAVAGASTVAANAPAATTSQNGSKPEHNNAFYLFYK